MEQIRDLVIRAAAAGNAREDRLQAFGELVERFQDMAYGYAYSVLGDFHLAEDAAQTAFITAFRRLEALREPEAFPGWFRRTVQNTCAAMTRRKELPVQPLETAPDVPPALDDPARTLEDREMREEVLRAVRLLPPAQREVTTLFYVNGYSQKDIAEFLEVPVDTVKNRLRASKERLRERMSQMVADEFKSHELPPEFPRRVRMLLELPRPLEIAGHPVREMWNLFRQCLPEFDLVDLEEVCERSVSQHALERMSSISYEIDSERMLRAELTSLMLQEWLARGGGPCRLVTVGRVFRKGPETATALEVHHQAEILWVAKGLNEASFHETMRRISGRILPGVPCQPEGSCSYISVPKGCYYAAPWRGQENRYAAGGVVSPEWIAKGGLDPTEFGGIGFAFGLERTAQVKLDLDDIRKLWQPPYVSDRV